MSNELIVSERNTTVMLGTIAAPSPLAVIGQATELADALARIITDRQLFTTLQGKKYVRVEGWTTLGAMLGVLPREVEATRLEDGGYLAVVELVRVSDGAVIGRGSALCGMDEKDRRGKPTWGSRAEYARRSMAITRATGKAYRLGFSWIMALAGYEPTPAEEMVIEGEYTEKKPTPPPAPAKREAPKKPPEPGPKLQTVLHVAVPGVESRPWTAIDTRRVLRAGIDRKQGEGGDPKFTAELPKYQSVVRGNLEMCFAGDKASTEKRHLLTAYVTGKASTNDLNAAEVETFHRWLASRPDADGNWAPDPNSVAEAKAMAKAAAIESGQQELGM